MEDTVAGGRIAVAGDWHGNTRWAVRAVRRMAALLPRDGPRVIVHLGDFGIWPGPGGREYLSWLHVAGRPVSNAVRGLAGLLGEPDGAKR